MRVRFDPEAHAYTLDGNAVPSVSGIIMPAYDFRFVKPEVLERAAALGSMVHKTVELFERGTLNLDTLHPFLHDHLKQWLRFKDECNFTYVRGEHIVYSEKYQYCGTYDCDGRFSDSQVLLDIKTGSKYEPHKLQTAGYKIAAVEMGILQQDCRRASLYLDRKGYELSFHQRDTQDVPAFLGLRTFERWERDNKCQKKR